MNISKKHLNTALIGLVLILSVYLAGASSLTAINDLTRADLSQHVSNQSCGVDYADSNETLHSECPENLKCYSDLKDKRIGVNVSGSRCVTPTFVEHHCGIFETYFTELSYPPSIGECHIPDTSLQKHILAILKQDNLFDRIFNTNQNGTELIRSHGLKLAAEAER